MQEAWAKSEWGASRDEVPFGSVTRVPKGDWAAAVGSYWVCMWYHHMVCMSYNCPSLVPLTANDQCSFCVLPFQVIMYDQHRKSTSL